MLDLAGRGTTGGVELLHPQFLAPATARGDLLDLAHGGAAAGRAGRRCRRRTDGVAASAALLAAVLLRRTARAVRRRPARRAGRVRRPGLPDRSPGR